MPRSCPLHQPDEYRRLRAERPVYRAVLPSGRPVWLITSHELARQILTDPRISANRFHPGFPHMFRHVPAPEAAAEQARFSHALIGRAFAVDGPEHAARKRLVVAEFTVKRVQTLRPVVQRIVDGILDAMLAGPRPVDLVRALALPVPSQVISELLGVSADDAPFFQQQTRIMVNHDSTVEQRQAANLAVLSKLDELITAKEHAPGGDLLSRLVERNREAGTLSHDELVGMAAFLLISGFETTANTIALGTVGLLEHPDQLAALMADPGLAPRAVEEMLRYFSVSDPAGSRVALADIEIGGEVIPAGEGVIAVAGAANWDPAVFDDPEAFDITREARHHLAFGHGAHQCLGLHLARLELEVVFGTLFQRVPTLRVTVPATELRYKTGANLYGIHELPVTW
ncbi:Cytochrome P450 [Goodfellowiella coeruleoviolacea]|uniref:Cytochrome P450 n=2 Tax=Goodfellowiella coeruleoviolacea TaxID=334858 RepID=A0AAE3KPT2_9PSEU|nr:Cytochrome P450 [Goodfellowiella coeruleoviolacea]